MSNTQALSALPTDTPSAADQIANDSASITLNDGKPYDLHYGFGGLRRIEAKYGSVRALLERIDDGMGDGYYDAVFHGLLYGLWKTGMTEETLEDLIEPADQDRYAPALTSAIVAAFPHQAQELIRERQREAQATTASPGPATTTSRRSGTGGRNKRSGT